MNAGDKASRNAFDLSKDGLMSRCHGRQGATTFREAQRLCVLAAVWRERWHRTCRVPRPPWMVIDEASNGMCANGLRHFLINVAQ